MGKGTINYCLINKSSPYSKDILSRYKEESASPVLDNFGNTKTPKVIRSNFVAGEIYQNQEGDNLKRSLIRHDSTKLAKAIIAIAQKKLQY